MFTTQPQSSDVYTSGLSSSSLRAHRNARGPATSFPLKLHQMLHKAEQCGYEDVVSWLPGGKSFKIHNPEGMVAILKTEFNQTKYKSFLRQIQNYGFHRFTRGPKKGICTHKLFVQWDPFMCLQMKRTNKANTGRLSPSMSSMVLQGHCLKTTSVGSLNKEPGNQAVLLHPRSSSSSKNAVFPEIRTTSSSIVSHFNQLPYEQDKSDDDSWLTKLLDHQDLWMKANTSKSSDNMFEPNQITFPERNILPDCTFEL